ncbi:MAG: S41 family peptidase [Blastocatellia bacterium]
MKGCSIILRSSVVKNRMKRIALTILLFVICSNTALAQSGALAPRDDSRDPRRESFDLVWSTVKARHFDPAFGGVDWDAVRRQYEPRVAAVKSDGELHDLLRQMLGELRQSHFYIMPPEIYGDETSKGPAIGGVGIDLRAIDGAAVVTRVAAGSSAARAGLRPGFVITQVDETRIAEASAKALERLKGREGSPEMTRHIPAGVALSRIHGKPGTSVRLQYLDDRDQPHDVTLVREPLPGEVAPAFGDLPAMPVDFEMKRLAGGVGYIRFNGFAAPVMAKIRAAVRELSDAAGIIIDLRGNGGGLAQMPPGIAGLLEQRQTSLGVMRMRAGHLNFAVFPQSNSYNGPVAILTDFVSMSASEVLAAGMQENGRAVIVGERTRGATLPAHVKKLPTGALFMFAVADYQTPKGVRIEGRGVAPDIEIKHNRAALLSGRDAQLDAAVEAVIKRSGQRRER